MLGSWPTTRSPTTRLPKRPGSPRSTDAEQGGVLCVAGDEPGTAKLRILLVDPVARGLGLGARLVETCLDFAGRAGYDRITLWTNDVLISARHIYQAAGFELVSEEPHHSFGHDLVGQQWSRPL